MALGHAGTTVFTAALPALFLTGRLAVAHLYAVMLALSVTASLSHNASRAALPAVVPEGRLDPANALLMATRTGGRLAFLLAGDGLTILLGPAAVLAGAAAGSVLAAGVIGLSWVDAGTVAGEGGLEGYLWGFRAGLRTIRTTPLLVRLLALGVATTCWSSRSPPCCYRRPRGRRSAVPAR